MLYKSTKNFNHKLLSGILSVILLMLSLSCTHRNNVVPAGIIAPDKMGKILTDMHLADAISNQDFPVKGGSDSIAWKNKSFTRLILSKYHIDSIIFNRSFTYYVQRPAEMDAIYGTMITDLNKVQARLPRDKQSIHEADSIAKARKTQPVISANVHGLPFGPPLNKKVNTPATNTK